MEVHAAGAPSALRSGAPRLLRTEGRERGLVERCEPDGATLQAGIGRIPNAVLSLLGNHRDLGIHSEMVSDGVIALCEQGAITNRRKRLHPGKSVTSFAMGTRRLYDFLDGNESWEFHDTAYVNSPSIIGKNQRVVSVNSALEVDITGQVCADSIGSKFFSGVGGQEDFNRGAAKSRSPPPRKRIGRSRHAGDRASSVAALAHSIT